MARQPSPATGWLCKATRVKAHAFVHNNSFKCMPTWHHPQRPVFAENIFVHPISCSGIGRHSTRTGMMIDLVLALNTHSCTLHSSVAGRAGERQSVRVACSAAPCWSGLAASQGHGRAECAAHPAEPDLSRQLPLLAAIYAGRGAAHREGICHGRWSYLHGTVDAPRMGLCVYCGGTADAVQRQFGKGPRTHLKKRKDRQ